MKKITATILSCILIGCTAVSCGSKKEENTASKVLPAEADSCIKDFVNNVFSGDGNGMLNCMYPHALISGLKSSGLTKQLYSALEMGVDGSLDKCTTSDEVKISEKAMKGAGVYFDSYTNMLKVSAPPYTVSDGYKLKMNVTVKSGSQKDSTSEDIIVVDVDGEGWKIIPMDEATLEAAADGDIG